MERAWISTEKSTGTLEDGVVACRNCKIITNVTGNTTSSLVHHECVSKSNGHTHIILGSGSKKMNGRDKHNLSFKIPK